MAYIFHLGMGKCGSSALQEYLSHNYQLTTHSGQTYYYATLKSDGSFLVGKTIADKAAKSPNNYVSSVTLRKDIEDQSLFKANFKNCLQKAPENLIFSHESWEFQFDLFQELILDCLPKDAEIKVIFFVRPPLTWLNSAWWQWGAWSKQSFDNWIKRNMNNVQWVNKISKWSACSRISETNVRLLHKDVVVSFLETFYFPLNNYQPSRNNVSLPNTVLRLYQKYPELRSGPHDAKIDFVLSKYLEINEKTDWVISKALVIEVLQKTKAANEMLLEFLDEDGRQAMLADPAWWDSAYYANKTVATPHKVILSDNENLELVAVQLITAVLLLDEQNRSIKEDVWELLKEKLSSTATKYSDNSKSVAKRMSLTIDGLKTSFTEEGLTSPWLIGSKLNKEQRKDKLYIEKSGEFDAAWYLMKYPDVANSGIDPLEHFVRFGAIEKRSPAKFFDLRFYVNRYQDVAESGLNPFVHYLKFGRKEGRLSSKDKSN